MNPPTEAPAHAVPDLHPLATSLAYTDGLLAALASR